MVDEYISKAEAIKQCGFGMTSLHIADNLRKMPPAEDVVQVCRCKYCKSYIDSRCWCTLNRITKMKFDFCSYGERKESK